MRPRELVQQWVEAFNRADPDALASFYAEDAVNHQVAEAPVSGKDAIRTGRPGPLIRRGGYLPGVLG